MKTKTKILTSLLTLVGVSTSSCMLIANNNIQSLNSNHNTSVNKLNNFQVIEKEFDAKLIGGFSGTFTIEYKDVNDCVIIDISKKFTAYGNFNFNGGHFTKDGITYTITEIDIRAFESTFTKHFHYCNLTIPSTIKKIWRGAFNCCYKIQGDKELLSISFEEGVEEIGHYAFNDCKDINVKTIKLPNSLKYLGEGVFENTKAEIIDLSALDHVIKIDYEAIGESGCLNTGNLKKIYVKNQEMKNKYCADYYWDTISKYVEVSQPPVTPIDPTPIEELSIPGTLIGAEDGMLTLDIRDHNNVIIKEADSDFCARGDFNFNGGHFTIDDVTYTITEIKEKVFFSTYHKYFRDCYLTIPSTIKKIGNLAFNGCGRIIGNKEIRAINFEEGIKEICYSAFAECDDIKEKIIKLPNSLKYIGENAFGWTKAEIIDLSALDHVIEVDLDVLNVRGCLNTRKLQKIYVKNQEMKNKYCADQKWKSAAKYFQVK